MQGFATRLKQLRGENTREEFAEKLGLSSRSLANYETGERIPKINTVALICSKLNIDANWLLFGGDTEEKKEAAPLAAVQTENQQPAISGCQQCFELYNKLVKSQENEIALILENAALKVIEKELRAELSLSASAADETPQPSTA